MLHLTGKFVLNVTRMIPDPETLKKRKVLVKRKSAKIDKKLAVYKFDSFEDFCNFANLLHSSTNNIIIKKVKKAILYSYNNNYYLVLNNILADLNLIKSFCAIIAEFSSYVTNSDLFEKKLNEYGKIIIKNNAIETCCKYFS